MAIGIHLSLASELLNFYYHKISKGSLNSCLVCPIIQLLSFSRQGLQKQLEIPMAWSCHVGSPEVSSQGGGRVCQGPLMHVSSQLAASTFTLQRLGHPPLHHHGVSDGNIAHHHGKGLVPSASSSAEFPHSQGDALGYRGGVHYPFLLVDVSSDGGGLEERSDSDTRNR